MILNSPIKFSILIFSNLSNRPYHQIVFTRGQRVEYYIGNDTTSSSNNLSSNRKGLTNSSSSESFYDYYRSIRNSTEGQYALSLSETPFK